MEHDGTGTTAGGDVEAVHGLRLMALLREVVRERDLQGAATELGVDPRTLAASIRRGRLSGTHGGRWSGACWRRASPQKRSGRQELRALAQRVDGQEERVAALEESSGAREGMSEAIEGLAEAVRGLERRLARLERAQARPGAGGAGGGRWDDGAGRGGSSGAEDRVPRGAPQGGDGGSEPGEEDVYGEAQGLVLAWREARKARLSAQGRLERAVTGERLLEVEIALIGEHGLTLSPETSPRDGIAMLDRLRVREKELEIVRRERVRAECRR